MTHHDDRLAGYALLGFGAGLYMFFKGFRQFRNYRLIADTPEIPIRSIPMGFVEIHGKAQGEKTVQSPLSHKPCFAYKVVIEKWKTESRGRGGSWSHHRTDTDGVEFYLADGTGKVRVNIQGAELDLPQSARCEVGQSSFNATGVAASQQELLKYVTQADVHWVGGLAERGLKSLGPLSDPDREAKRQTLLGAFSHMPGSPDFLTGMMTMMAPKMKQHLESLGPQADPQHEQARLTALRALDHPPGSPEFLEGLRQAQQMADAPGSSEKFDAFLRATSGAPGAVTDMLGAASGRYRMTEFCLVPGADYDISGTCVENPHPQDEYDRNLIMKGTNEKVFLISSKTEKQFEGGMRNRAVKMILGGAALSVICLAILLAKLGWL